eukprot:scaffold130302_cov33-Tisochrysis_lutea.AAC.1
MGISWWKPASCSKKAVSAGKSSLSVSARPMGEEAATDMAGGWAAKRECRVHNAADTATSLQWIVAVRRLTRRGGRKSLGRLPCAPTWGR